MLDYIIAVICAVAVSGIIMLVVFHRLKVLSFRTVASVALASLVTALIMPSIFNVLSRSEAEKTDPTILIILTVAAFIAYMLIVMILSILISVIVPKTEKSRNLQRLTPAFQAQAKPKPVRAKDGARTGRTAVFR